MPSAKVAEFLEHAEHYRRLKDHAPDPALRRIVERMESSFRILAKSREQLERSKKQVEALDQRVRPPSARS
jgi:hypothetical protein